MVRVLLVADVPWVLNDARATLSGPGYELLDTTDPSSAAATAYEFDVDVVVADLQVGSMGGMAITRHVRAYAGRTGRAAPAVVMLLDRSADAWLARRAAADGWVAKPFTARQIRSAITTALERPIAGAGDDGRGDGSAGIVPAEPVAGG
ncbi:MAG: response regulator [Acidimicrobiia bacterium]|nr:response regulator [Acidimicrobiia bacterium]